MVANGQGEMKGKLFRMAHIGYYDYLDTIGSLAALEHVLAHVTGKPAAFGSAVRAAQEVFARQSQTAGRAAKRCQNLFSGKPQHEMKIVVAEKISPPPSPCSTSRAGPSSLTISLRAS